MGRTHVHFETRRQEHLETDKESSVYKHHRKNQLCKNANGAESFTLLDFAKNDYDLALKEAMHIKWVSPNLNGQKKHAIITLAI